MTEALSWLEDNHCNTTGFQGDFIDLSKGRDFLKENKKYDVVILHFIFRGELLRTRALNDRRCRVSSESGWYNWRKRLQSTEAKYIFVFGGLSEISGTFLVNISGYNVHRIRTETEFSKGERIQGLWIFEKI